MDEHRLAETAWRKSAPKVAGTPKPLGGGWAFVPYYTVEPGASEFKAALETVRREHYEGPVTVKARRLGL